MPDDFSDVGWADATTNEILEDQPETQEGPVADDYFAEINSIQAKMLEAKAEAERLQDVLDKKRHDAMQKTAEELIERINTMGWKAAEVLGHIEGEINRVFGMIRLPGMTVRPGGADMLGDDLVTPRKRKSPGTGAQAKAAPKFRLKTDAALGYAGRGRLPNWMMKMLEDAGIDPTNQEKVAAWKDENLVEV